MVIKGHTTALRVNRFQEVVTMTSLTLREYTVSDPHTFVDGHEHNNGTLGYEHCVAQRYSFLCLS